ncbi:hypothetical protein DRE_02102 [Drechslerella stenobrocha 248]|uniref:Uncharacterized protein n=1 Tax=Drechslerella stenobrocha 248 TaxID=1043628 RepID=W7I7N2_9PEZI|nr:hypothetical protein DRE_02102 [Drechslerella stenobrocha 248]
MAKLKVDPAIIAAAQATVALDNYSDWSARRVATYSRVLENALAKVKREVELAGYSSKSVSTVPFKQLFTAPDPASKWEWDPKTEHDLMNEVHIRRASCQQPRKQGYADASASRRKGIALQPRRLSPKKGASGSGSVFDNYRQNPNLRRSLLISGANPAVRPHYATILQQHASVLKPRKDTRATAGAVPSLAVLSARAFGRAIVMARDAEDLQGDSSWYSYCDESSCMYYLLTETLRGHITQLLCDALKEEWFPTDLASTLIAQSVDAGDAALTERLFHAAYQTSLDKNRSVARRKGELAPDPFSHILYMPDVLFRQISIAVADRPETMLDTWFRDVLFAGIGEIGSHAELPAVATTCLEMLLGIEVWEGGVHRRRMNRSGKPVRKKYESFDKAWLFQSKAAVQAKAADVAQDLVERLFEVGWGALVDRDETRATARAVLSNLVGHMVLWSRAFNHPHKEVSEGSSITARTLALCAVLLSGQDDASLSNNEVAEELVRLLLVTMIEASEDHGDARTGDEAADTFDLPDLAGYVAGVLSRVFSSPAQQQGFVEGLLGIAIGDTNPDFMQTPGAGDKAKLQQKRQNYVIAIFAYHLATCLADSSKSKATHSFAAEVEHRLVGLRISKRGLLKASDLKTPKFSNLVRDLAMSEARSSRWVYEPMLNEWVEVPAEAAATDCSNNGSGSRVSRKLNFSESQRPGNRHQTNQRQTINYVTPDDSLERLSNSEDDLEHDSTVYPPSTDTTMMEADAPTAADYPSLPNFLVEVSIYSPPKAATPISSPATSPILPLTSSSGLGGKISHVFGQSKRALRGAKRKRGEADGKPIFGGVENAPPKAAAGERKVRCPDDNAEDASRVYPDCDSMMDDPAVPVPARKRGRPKKHSNARKHVSEFTTNSDPTIVAPAVVIEQDPAYEPDSDDCNSSCNRPNALLARKRKREGFAGTHHNPANQSIGGQAQTAVKRGRGRPPTNSVAKIDVYQDELDLITSATATRRASTGGLVFGSTNTSKLNLEVGVKKSRLGEKSKTTVRGRTRRSMGVVA